MRLSRIKSHRQDMSTSLVEGYWKRIDFEYDLLKVVCC